MKVTDYAVMFAMKNQIKEAIADTFFALAQKKNIDKITVKELVDACGISRQTFYYHFQDILEVIEWQAQRLAENMAVQIRATDSPERAARILASFFAEHHVLLKKLQDSQKRDFVEKLVLDAMQEHLRLTLRNSTANMPPDITTSEAETLISFFSYGLAGLLLSRCHGRSPDVNELTRQIMIVLRQFIPKTDTLT